MKSLVFFLMIGAALLPIQAQAGFDFAEDGITISNMPGAATPAPQKKVEFTPAVPVEQSMSAEPASGEPQRLDGAIRPPSDPNDPALTTFNDRYVPDTIKKKYKISPEWYVRGAEVPMSSLIQGDHTEPVIQTAQPQQAQQAQAQPPVPLQPAAQPQPQQQPQPRPEPIDPEMSVSHEVPSELNAPRGMSEAPLPSSQPGTMVISDKPIQAPAIATKAPAYIKVASWRARKGEPVREVIRRWSEREGTEMMWAAPNDPVLAKDYSKVGTLQEAVTGLLRDVGQPLYTQFRSDGLNPVMMSPASTVTSDVAPEPPAAPVELVTADPPKELRAKIIKPSSPPSSYPDTQSPDTGGELPVPQGELRQADFPVEPLSQRHATLQAEPQPQAFKATLGPIQRETRWFALSGASLKEVMQVWADDEGAELIWQAGGDYALFNSVSQVGHFEDAVFKALSQFDEQEGNRPVGEMYKNPGTGKKVLLIKTDSPS